MLATLLDNSPKTPNDPNATDTVSPVIFLFSDILLLTCTLLSIDNLFKPTPGLQSDGWVMCN